MCVCVCFRHVLSKCACAHPKAPKEKKFDIEMDIRLESERMKICTYSIGQHFVHAERVLQVPRVYERFGWEPSIPSTYRGKAVFSVSD